MKWYTALEVSTKYDISVNTVRTHIKRKKFGKNQRQFKRGDVKMWLISEKGAVEQYGNQENTK